MNKDINLAVNVSFPTKEEILDKADEYGFRVPYDGSNNFYDDEAIKHFIAGAKWYQSAIKVKEATKPERMGMGKLRNLINQLNSEDISISKFLGEINNHFLSVATTTPLSSSSGEEAVGNNN
jgi:hypothetical protein